MSSIDDGATAVTIEPARLKTTAPLVSVIIPAYNAEAFIRTALASALHQSYEPIEIIVIDDGSVDRTVEIVREFMARDPRVRLVQQANAGVAAARNHGIRTAQGSLIAPLDADDLWRPMKIERQVARFLAADERLALVYTWSHIVDEDGRIMARRRRSLPQDEGSVFQQLIESNFIGNGSSPLMRKDYVLEAGGFDPELRARNAEGCEDWKLYLALAERYEFAVVRESLVGYRQTSGMMSRNLWAMKRSCELLLDDVRSRNPELSEDVLRRNSTFFAIWLATQDVSALKFALAACWKDPLGVVRPAVRRQLMWLPLRYLYRSIRAVSPELGRRLENLRRIGREPFLDDIAP